MSIAVKSYANSIGVHYDSLSDDHKQLVWLFYNNGGLVLQEQLDAFIESNGIEAYNIPQWCLDEIFDETELDKSFICFSLRSKALMNIMKAGLLHDAHYDTAQIDKMIDEEIKRIEKENENESD